MNAYTNVAPAVTRLFRMNGFSSPARRRPLRPAHVLAGSFTLAILAGAGLLMLPEATIEGGLGAIDALFTSASAVCVTGLVVVDTGTYFTRFGQAVILTLIQIGGLGVMTVSVLIYRALGRSVTFRQRSIMQDVFTHTPRRDIQALLRSMFVFTALAELAGAVALYPALRTGLDAGDAAWSAVFHAVSAFCNAGFSLRADSMIGLRASPTVNLTILSLIVLGGLGFPVIHELAGRGFRRGHSRSRWSLQTRIVLTVTAGLIVFGAAAFWLLERHGVLAGLPAGETAMAALFQSITCRTAGFNSVDIGSLREPTLLVMALLMFIGASPGSCGGGIKTTTFAITVLYAISRVRRGEHLSLFRRGIPEDTASRVLSLLVWSLAVVGLVWFLLLALTPAEGNDKALGLLFETVSAFGTVGLSMGATSGLTAVGKLLVIATMLIGRVGVLTFAYVLTPPAGNGDVQYAEENVMVG